MTDFQAASKMRELMAKYYFEAKTTQEKPIAWVTSGAPVEFLYAMDILPIYPENYSAMCGAAKVSLPLIEAAEAAGFSSDICSYARTDFGADLTRGGPVQGLPAPRFLLCSTNICKTVIKWYEVVARKYRVPLFIVDTPFLHDGLSRELIDYTVMQFEALERFLEEFLGRPFDRDRFQEVLEESHKASNTWKKILELGKKRPSPFNSQDTFIHLAPIVTLRGTPECSAYYQLLYEEIADRAMKGIGTMPREKYRALWDNLPIWYRLRRLADFFQEHECALVVATYTNSWGGLGDDYDPARPYEGLARAYLSPYINAGFEHRIKYLTTLVEEYGLTGFVLHSDRSCKPYSVGMYRMQEEVSRLTGKPGVIIEGDMCDPRAYADAQVETRLEALFEAMDTLA
jgi:bcr-type benzoyl-CoA reductase subunit B